jgi:hypothetical protein
MNRIIRKTCCFASLITIFSWPPLMAARPSLLEIPEVTKDKVICFALYTVHNNILKMTAQLYPLDANDPRTVRLQMRDDGKWAQIAESKVIDKGWIATFRIEGWDSTCDTQYRLAHGTSAFYTGTIKNDPVDKDVIVVAAFTGNSIYPRHGGDIPSTTTKDTTPTGSNSAGISVTSSEISPPSPSPTTTMSASQICGELAGEYPIPRPDTTADTSDPSNTSTKSNAHKPATSPTPMTPRPSSAVSASTTRH